MLATVPAAPGVRRQLRTHLSSVEREILCASMGGPIVHDLVGRRAARLESSQAGLPGLIGHMPPGCAGHRPCRAARGEPFGDRHRPAARRRPHRDDRHPGRAPGRPVIPAPAVPGPGVGSAADAGQFNPTAVQPGPTATRPFRAGSAGPPVVLARATRLIGAASLGPPVDPAPATRAASFATSVAHAPATAGSSRVAPTATPTAPSGSAWSTPKLDAGRRIPHGARRRFQLAEDTVHVGR